LGKPKDAIWNFYDVGDDKTNAKYKECQSDEMSQKEMSSPLQYSKEHLIVLRTMKPVMN